MLDRQRKTFEGGRGKKRQNGGKSQTKSKIYGGNNR